MSCFVWLYWQDTAGAELKSQISGTEAPNCPCSAHKHTCMGRPAHTHTHTYRWWRARRGQRKQPGVPGPSSFLHPSTTSGSHGAVNILLTLLTHYQISMEHTGTLDIPILYAQTHTPSHSTHTLVALRTVFWPRCTIATIPSNTHSITLTTKHHPSVAFFCTGTGVLNQELNAHWYVSSTDA